MSRNGKLARIENSYAAIDEMPPALRQCVHEFGYAIVYSCLANGVKDPAKIRQLVHEIWHGARQPMQKDGRGMGAKAASHIDWILINAGAQISAMTLVRVLRQAGLVIVPMEPNKAMLEASVATVSGGGERMTKTEKHRRRLRAAIEACTKSMWPHLCDPNL